MNVHSCNCWLCQINGISESVASCDNDNKEPYKSVKANNLK